MFFLTNREVAESFIEGVLTYIDEITMFMNPLTNSYARFGSFEAPKYVAWSNTKPFSTCQNTCRARCK